MAHWSDKYIGRPYSTDYDCGHLFVEVNLNEFGRKVPISNERSNNIFALCRQIDEQLEHVLDPVPAEEAQEGDAVLMISLGRLSHIGVLVILNNIRYVLHNIRNANVCLHQIQHLDRIHLKVEGYYRPKPV